MNKIDRIVLNLLEAVSQIPTESEGITVNELSKRLNVSIREIFCICEDLSRLDEIEFVEQSDIDNRWAGTARRLKMSGYRQLSELKKRWWQKDNNLRYLVTTIVAVVAVCPVIWSIVSWIASML